MIGAVDIGGTKRAVGMVTESGQVLARKESPTDAVSYANGLATIAGLLRETAQIASVEITGIGIGSTGPVDPFTGKFGEVDFLPGWRGQNPVEDLARIFHVQVELIPNLATRSSIPLDRSVLAVSGAAGNRWLRDQRWWHGLMRMRRPIIRIANISPPSASASSRGRTMLWLSRRLSGRPTTWGLVWPTSSICSHLT